MKNFTRLVHVFLLSMLPAALFVASASAQTKEEYTPELTSFTTYSSSNGIFLEGNDFQLGGELSKDTNINTNGYDFTYSGGALGEGTKLMWVPDKSAFRAGTTTLGGWDHANLGNYSTAFGVSTIASGNGSFAAGGDTKALGSYSVAFGSGSTATGERTFTMGSMNNAIGTNSSAFGFNTSTPGWYSSAFGHSTKADAFGSFVIGQYNIGGGSANFWNTNDKVFEIGMGTDNISRANALTVLKNGQIGIGEATPTALLHVNPATIARSQVRLESSNGVDPSSPNDGDLWWNGTELFFYSGTDHYNLLSDITPAVVTPTYTASNGVVIVGNDIQLGGVFEESNIVDTAGNNLNYVGEGKFGFGTNSSEFTLNVDGGIIAKGNYGQGESLSTSGFGTRMIWYPRKAAFRAGTVGGMDWNDSNIGFASIALGQDTLASGSNSFAVGSSTKATGSSSTALGRSSVASGDASFAAGDNSRATGMNSTSIGVGNQSSGSWSISAGSYNTSANVGSIALGTANNVTEVQSIALGDRNNVTGFYSLAVGNRNNVSANNSSVLGDRNVVSGSGSTVGGRENTVLQDAAYSTVFGKDNFANGNFVTTIGYKLKSTSAFSTSIGKYNVGGGSSNQYTWNANDPLFEVGYGVNEINRANAFTILKGGNVGIGTHTPTALLQINPANTTKAQIRLSSSEGVNPSSPNNGDMWWNGSELSFYDGTEVHDLLETANVPDITKGTATFTYTTSEYVVESSAIKPDSFIMVTPLVSSDGTIPVVAVQKVGDGFFRVVIKDSTKYDSKKAMQFNWMIVE